MEAINKCQEIGSGSFSTVFLLTDSQGNKQKKKVFKSESLAAAQKEYYFLEAIKGDGTPQPISYASHPQPSIIMEWIEGVTLDNMDNLDANIILQQLATIILRVHALGICINDLKPDNVIIARGKTFLVDFGLASNNLHNDNNFRGSINYAAPEKLHYYTNSLAGDIFSLGMLLLYIKKLHPRQLGLNYQEISQTATTWQAFLSKHVSDPLISTMLAYSPAKRPSIATILRQLNVTISPRMQQQIIQSYVFINQQKVASKLWKEKKIRLTKNDEVEKIIQACLLIAIDNGKKLIFLDEKDYIANPLSCMQALDSSETKIDNEKNFLVAAQHPDIAVLICRYAGGVQGQIFDKLAKHCHQIEITEISDMESIKKDEISMLSKHMKMSTSQIHKLVRASPQLLRFSLLHNDSKPSNPQELTNLLAFLEIRLPFNLLVNVFSPAQIIDALRDDGIIKISNYFSCTTKTATIPAPSLLEKVYQTAIDLDYQHTAAQIAWQRKQTDVAIMHWENKIRRLNTQMLFRAAHLYIQEIRRMAGNFELGLILSKREASLERRLGNKQIALKLYKNLLAKHTGMDFADLLADTALVYQQLNNLEEAEKCYQAAIPIYEKHHQVKSLLRVRNNLGTILFYQKRLSQAQKSFSEVLRLAQTISEEKMGQKYISLAYLNLTDVFQLMGQWEKSLLYSQQAITYAQKNKLADLEGHAKLMAVFSHFSLGKNQDLPFAMGQMLADQLIEQNPPLYIEMLTSFLFIFRFILPAETENIALRLSKLADKSNAVYQELALHAYHAGRITGATDYLNMMTASEEKDMLEAIFAGHEEDVIMRLNQLADNDQLRIYYHYTMHILILPGLSARIKKNVQEFIRLNPFLPALEYLNENRASSHQFPLLWEILSYIHHDVSYDKTMQAVLMGINKISKLERAVFFAYKDDEYSLEMAFNAQEIALPPASVRVSTSLLNKCIEAGQIQFFENLQEELGQDTNSSIFGLGLRTAVAYPLEVQGQVRGVIYADARADKLINSAEKKLLEAIFVQARYAFEKNMLLERYQASAVQSTYATSNFHDIIGSSPALQKVFRQIAMVGRHNVNVLIYGETGSGKELVARALHNEYKKDAPFIAVNCAAIPENLLESELFGYVKGAFTGATQAKKGKIEVAQDGSLFLDEIGDMPLQLQAKLLRVTQEREVVPLGGTKAIKVNFRIISASNKKLDELVSEKLFRQDLLFRLKVFDIVLPPLRERREDIPLLAKHFMDIYNKKYKKDIIRISPLALKKLRQHSWEGNIRELENEIEKAVILAVDNEIEADLFSFGETESEFNHGEIPSDWQEYKEYKKTWAEQLDKQYASVQLEKAHGNISKACRSAGLTRTQMYRLLGN